MPFCDGEAFLQDTKIALISVLEDPTFAHKVDFFSRYEARSEEGVIALLAKAFLQNKKLPTHIAEYFEDLDNGYLSAETNIGEEEIEELCALINAANKPKIILGPDLALNPHSKNIQKFIALLLEYSGLQIDLLFATPSGQIKVPEPISPLQSFDGTVVFEYCSDEPSDILRASAQFSTAAKVQDGQDIAINIDNRVEYRKFVLDDELKGTIALMPSAAKSASCRYKVAKITKREIQ